MNEPYNKCGIPPNHHGNIFLIKVLIDERKRMPPRRNSIVKEEWDFLDNTEPNEIVEHTH